MTCEFLLCFFDFCYYPYPLRWFGGAGGGPSTAQGLQHRLHGLHQRRGGGRRGAPPGGGRLKQPPNTTVSGCQITGEMKNHKRRERERKRASLPPIASIAPMSPAVIIFYFCISFHCFLYEKKINMFLFSFLYFVIWVFVLFFWFSCSIHTSFFSSSSASSPLCLHLKKRAPFQKQKCSCQFCCFNNCQLKEKEKTSKPAPFYLLMT